MVDVRNDLVKRFVDAQNDDKLLSELTNICQQYTISPEDLFYKWEAMNYNRPMAHLGSVSLDVFTMDSVHALKAALHSDAAAKTKKLQQRAALNASMGRSKAETGLRFSKSALASGAAVTPGAAGIMGAGSSKVSIRVSFKGPSDNPNERKKRRYRYMYEKISERSEVLDEQIDEFGEIVRKYYNFEDLGDPSSTTEEEIIVVGRICNATSTPTTPAPPKLTDSSLFLESSRMMGSGARVPLRFDAQLKVRGGIRGAGSVGLFPGALVALKGKNGGGGYFGVSEMLGIPPLTIDPSSQGGKLGVKAERGAFTMCIACGPYTPDSELEFKPLASFLDKIKTSRPAVLLLQGPFIDASHSLIKSGDVDYTPPELFHQRFAERLRDFLSASPDSLIILVPSVRDVLSDHPVSPQCELSNEFAFDPRVRLLPNPCRFSINGISFAASSVDVLFHLRNQEFMVRGEEVESWPATGDAPGNDAMANMCRHLFQQRSFYPIYPVPAEMSHDINLDVTHVEGMRLDSSDPRCDYAPDVLVVPSRLKHFSKVVDGTMAVNPSYLTKGTYATLHVGDNTSAPVKDRMKCEVHKL
ncbi:DNA polymerase alpha, subunit B [Rickenella mellea]|uniref:DNA polymerase alpha subunit B n=1 Tax=Rickenella mellea TaxID=50990 RepID=A0A4Y7PS71_9AGAM|nr:DNA polymerase alpha, subunit B [Rickenella mellea]